MDAKLRELIETAEIDAAYALLELRLFKGANWRSALDHVQRIIVQLDEALDQIHCLDDRMERRH